MHVGFAAGPVVFTDRAGHLVEERRYEPFGAPLDARTATGNGIVLGPPDLVDRDLNILDKRTEAATGWSDHGARWYSPETARWATTDPLVVGPDAKMMTAPWALHPYQYAQQNPSAYWDPDGRQPRDLEAEVAHVYAELGARGRADVFEAIGIVVEGWRVVVAEPRRTDKQAYDALVSGRTAADAISSVVQLAGDTPIQRLLLEDHGYEGTQTFMGELVFDVARSGKATFEPLLKLAGKFTPDGVLVLGGCNVLSGDDAMRRRTIDGMKQLSSALNVEVRAGSGLKSARDDELWHPDVTACRGDRCVTANSEHDLAAAWHDQK
jgi:RHS repeat-associated protein